ncbi:hypothetical protein FACS189446_5970 [Bacteroidia bacterium]|nr:hypothetical protein FACS189446_5970 [Bacteroidia bacterium]
MREKMKKMLFLMLFLLVLGAANVISQVRIGGNGQPQGAAVLDLNADNNATPTGNKGALALPRVSLASATANLNSTTPINGMLVYNTNITLGAGVYYWNTNQWVKVLDGSFVEGDAIVGNEITDTIANGGLTRSGSGTAVSPYKVGIKTNGIVNNMIADRAVSLGKISSSAADSGKFLFATGSGVKTGTFYDGAVTDTLSLVARAPRVVSWGLILDTNVLVNLRANHITQIPAIGIVSGDVCLPYNTAHLMNFWSGPGYVSAVTLHASARAASVGVRCWRLAY